MRARHRCVSAYSERVFPQPGNTLRSPAQRPRSSRQRADAPGEPAALSARQLTDRLTGPLVRCVSSGLGPDAWFPVARAPERARAEAAGALAVCAQCRLRAECLEVSMRQWATVGRHGIWGGFVEAERAALRAAWRAGVPVTALIGSGASGTRQPSPAA